LYYTIVNKLGAKVISLGITYKCINIKYQQFGVLVRVPTRNITLWQVDDHMYNKFLYMGMEQIKCITYCNYCA